MVTVMVVTLVDHPVNRLVSRLVDMGGRGKRRCGERCKSYVNRDMRADRLSN